MKITAVLWTVFIVYLSHTSGEETSRQSRALSGFLKIPERFLRVSAHFVCYFVLGILASAGWAQTGPLCGVLTGIALTDEWSKQFVTGRHFCWWEALINVASALLGVLCVRVFCRF